MNSSDSWLKIKSKFSQQLSLLKSGNIESDSINKELDVLLSENNELGNENLEELTYLVIDADLSEGMDAQLLNSISEQKTRLSNTNSSTESSEKNLDNNTGSISEKHSSSLLRDLLTTVDDKLPTNIMPGQTIRGTYRIENKVGYGGMGDVWKAVDLIQDAGEAKDKYVAIKFISREIKNHPYALKALVREFGRYKKLIHPNIVKAYELNRDNNDVFIAMEYLEGAELKKFIKQNPEGISLEQAQPIIKGMCDALEYAHNEGIIHLDFKPGNVFYDPVTKVCKVIDFGIARLSDPEERDKTRFDPGALSAMTTAYASCEMLIDSEPDPRDDVYSLSCVIYELLSGHHPFDKKTALKVEREKIQVKPISGLGKFELKALKRGLKLNKENRTGSALQLYTELYEPQQVATQKRNRWIIFSFIVAFLVTAIPFAIYKGYHNWQLNEVKMGIENQSNSAISDFISLSADQQNELLLDQSLRLDLVKSLSMTASRGDLFGQISKLESNIQKLIFSDQNVREYLITFYQNNTAQAVKEDDFELAEHLSQRVSQQYADSMQLIALSDNIKQQKATRIAALKVRYQQCLDDQSQNLEALFPCLKETRAMLRKIDHSMALLTESKSRLGERYTIEISAAIDQNELSLAATLLLNWRSLEINDTTNRTELTDKLAYANKVNKLIHHFTESNDIKIAEMLKTLPDQTPELIQKVLADNGVKQRLMDYYSKNINQSLDKNDFSFALKHIAEGKALLSSENEQNILKQLEKNVLSKKVSYISDLEQRYDQQLVLEEPNIQDILTIQKDVAAAAPEHQITQLPWILENYKPKIETAIVKDQFELAERLLDNWIELKHADSASKEFLELTDKKKKYVQAFQDRKIFSSQLKKAIDSNQLEQVSALLVQINNKLEKKDRQKIVTEIKQPLLNLYHQHIDEAIQQDKFVTAFDIFTQMKTVFPENSEVLKNKKKLSNAKSQRIKALLTQAKTAMNSTVIVGSDIFLPLNKINEIDKDYLNQEAGIFQDLKTILIMKVDQESSLSELQNVIPQWNGLITQSQNMSQKTKDLFNKTKNIIALRCLFKGRNFKSQQQNTMANEFFMFGLSLDPVLSVRNALEKELF